MLTTIQFGRTVADAANDQAAVAIPPELEVLMAGWEDNFGRIRTFQADARLRTEDARFLACKDLDNKSYPDQNANISIWKDNANFRADIVYDRTFDIRNNKLHYHLPYGEHIMPTTDWKQQKENLKREHGILQTTTRFMQLEDKAFNYLVEGKDFTIDRATDFFPGPQACEWMWKGSILGSETFPEYIRSYSRLPSTKSFLVEDLGQGRYAVLQNFIGTKGETQVPGKTRLIINATQGYTVESVTREAGGQLIYDAEYKYTKLGNTWVLVGAEFKRYSWMEEVHTVESTVSLSVDVNSLKVNEPVDPNIFTVESLDIQKGSLVRDSVAGKRYLYNDIPIRLKAALAEAQNLIGEPLDDQEDPLVEDTLPTEAAGPPPLVSRTEPVPQDDKIDASPTIPSLIGTSSMWTLLVGIVVGAAVAATMVLFHREQKSGEPTNES